MSLGGSYSVAVAAAVKAWKMKTMMLFGVALASEVTAISVGATLETNCQNKRMPELSSPTMEL